MVLKDYPAAYRGIQEVSMDGIPHELIEYRQVHVMVEKEFVSETVNAGEVYNINCYKEPYYTLAKSVVSPMSQMLHHFQKFFQ